MKADNWRRLLVDYIESRRERPFIWGQNDCCLFVADWALIATGFDPAQSYRGVYDSAMQAHRIASEHGGVGGLVAHCLAGIGAQQIDAAHVTAGDIIIRDSVLGDCAGIVIGQKAAFVGEYGLTFADIHDDKCADFWRF